MVCKTYDTKGASCGRLSDKIRFNFTYGTTKNLSYVGKIQMIRWVIYGKLNFWFQDLILPKLILDWVRKIIYGFVLGRKKRNKLASHGSRWLIVCVSKVGVHIRKTRSNSNKSSSLSINDAPLFFMVSLWSREGSYTTLVSTDRASWLVVRFDPWAHSIMQFIGPVIGPWYQKWQRSVGCIKIKYIKIK